MTPQALRTPLSFAQQRLWLLNELYPESRAYSLRTAYSLQGELDVPALRRALTEIVRRHEALRTTFATNDGEPFQIVAAPAEVSLPIIDVPEVPDTPQEARVQAQLHAAGARAFDLTRGPLFRATLFRSTPYDHVLLFVMHHIVFDDGSLPAFNRELTALYAAYHRGVPHTLPDLPIQYPDFALWQRESTQETARARQLAYWRAQLADAPARVELPQDHPRPVSARFNGAVESITLGAVLCDRIRSLGSAQRTTPFMTLLAAFTVLLYRYTGQRDLVVGTPIANRTRTELEPLIGFFVNTLALRTRLDGGETFVDVLRSVRETAIGAYEHQDVPFEQVVAELRPVRSPGSTPIINVMFFVRAALGGQLELDGLRVQRRPLHSTSSRFDLTLRITEQSGGLACSLQYDTDLFDAPKIKALLAHFTKLLESIVADPNRHIATLPMLSSLQREQLIIDWNATATPYAGDRTLAELFEAEVERTPQAKAVGTDDAHLTYRELNERANRLAHALRDAGLAPGATVGICTERSIAMVVCILAVVKAGGVYVPLDAHDPPARLAFILRDANVRIVLTHHGLFPASFDGPEPIVLDVEAPAIRQRSANNIASARCSDDVVYVMYTSGSTGRPKGVLIVGRAISRLVTGMQYVTLGAGDGVAQASNGAFDAVTFELWGALLNGARLEIIAREVLLAPQLFASALAARDISVLFLTTALFAHLAGTVPSAFARLRYLLVGGETLDAAAAQAVLETDAPKQLLNMYGTTETTTFACAYAVTLPLSLPVPIGRPISNTQAYVLDADRNVLPPGVPGELYIGGPGLARGYVNDAELTARKFIAHPFSNDAETRLYATGDSARYRSDGNIEFLGRADRQVKIRGFRVELDEIESALKSLPAVRDAVVQLRSDGFGGKRLVAHVVDATRPQRTLQTWRKLLGRIVPDYMLPAAVIAVPAFTLTANGKIDMDALPDPSSHANAAPDPRFEDSRHDVLSGLFRDLLGVAAVQRRDNFFDLGGHSLLAARLIADVERVFGRRVSLAAFLANPSIDHLAALLSADGTDAGVASPLLTLRATGWRTPFFFLHGDLSGGYYVHKIVRRLAESQPFYVLAPHGVDGSPLPATIEEMARDYVRVIRETHPHGPYILGGFSSAGLVAFEMARQLQAASERVSSVILLDAPGSHGCFRAPVELADRLASILRIGELRRDELYGRAARAAQRALRAVRSLQRARKRSGLIRLPETLVRLAFERRQSRTTQHADEAATLEAAWRRMTTSYFPRRYRGRVTLLVPQEVRPLRSQSIAGWASVADTLHVDSVPGDHLSCITRFVDETATALDEQLASGIDEPTSTRLRAAAYL